MDVEFHCGKCGKLVRAPQESSGKRGKCPYCKQSVYIPTPSDQIEDIPLAPMNGEVEEQRDELDDEAKRLVASLGHTDAEAVDGEKAAPDDAGSADISRMVVETLLAMHESRLDDAEQIIRRLRRNASKTRAHIERLMVDEMPPAKLEDCPTALYKGFLRNILEQL